MVLMLLVSARAVEQLDHQILQHDSARLVDKRTANIEAGLYPHLIAE